jgi:hypothetical protein
MLSAFQNTGAGTWVIVSKQCGRSTGNKNHSAAPRGTPVYAQNLHQRQHLAHFKLHTWPANTEAARISWNFVAKHLSLHSLLLTPKIKAAKSEFEVVR